MVSRYDHCEMALLESAEFAPIFPKLNSMDMPSMAFLADDTEPTNSETKLLVEFYDRRQPCMQRMIEDAGHIHPAMVTFLAQSYRSAADTYL